MRFKRILLVRGAEAQVGANENQRRTLGFAPCRPQSQVDRLHIISVLHRLRMPTIRLKAPRVIFVTGDVRTCGQRHMVVIEEVDQFAEFQLPGERRRLGRHALHQISVAYQPVSEMINDLEVRPVVTGREMGFGDRHADAIAESLSERARGGFHTRCQAALGMTGRNAAPLAELFDLVKRQIVAGEVQQAVQQRRAVAGRQDETVPIEPLRNDGIMP